MKPTLVNVVRQRAGECCEYCRLPQAYATVPFEIDHIRAKKHRGPTTEENLALACFYCNSAKGSNAAGYDPDSGKLVPLFHPRRQAWSRHFRWQGAVLIGRTQTGRATIAVLRINDEGFVAFREALAKAGLFPFA